MCSGTRGKNSRPSSGLTIRWVLLNHCIYIVLTVRFRPAVINTGAEISSSPCASWSARPRGTGSNGVQGPPFKTFPDRNFVRKTAHFLKKIKCSKQPKKQNKLNFYLSLSGVPNASGGWVGSNVWDKVPNKTVFFGDLPLLRIGGIWKSGHYPLATDQRISSRLGWLLYSSWLIYQWVRKWRPVLAHQHRS